MDKNNILNFVKYIFSVGILFLVVKKFTTIKVKEHELLMLIVIISSGIYSYECILESTGCGKEKFKSVEKMEPLDPTDLNINFPYDDNYAKIDEKLDIIHKSLLNKNYDTPAKSNLIINTENLPSLKVENPKDESSEVKPNDDQATTEASGDDFINKIRDKLESHIEDESIASQSPTPLPSSSNITHKIIQSGNNFRSEVFDDDVAETNKHLDIYNFSEHNSMKKSSHLQDEFEFNDSDNYSYLNFDLDDSYTKELIDDIKVKIINYIDTKNENKIKTKVVDVKNEKEVDLKDPNSPYVIEDKDTKDKFIFVEETVKNKKLIKKLKLSNQIEDKIESGDHHPEHHPDHSKVDCKEEVLKVKKQMQHEIMNLKNQVLQKHDNTVHHSKKPNNLLDKKKLRNMIKQLEKQGILDKEDIEEIHDSIKNKESSIDEIMSQLHQLKNEELSKMNRLTDESTPNQMKVNSRIRDMNPDKFPEMGYNELDQSKLIPIGDQVPDSWENEYTLLNTDKWTVPMTKPKLCIATSNLDPLPTNEPGYPLNLKEWDNSRKISNTYINKKWANDQVDSSN